MKLFKKMAVLLGAVTLSCTLLTACGGNDPEYYTVKYDANGGMITVENEVRVEKGESLILPDATYKGYTFVGWYDGSTLAGAAGSEYTPVKNVTLKATWEEAIDYATENMERAIEYAKLIHSVYWDSSRCRAKEYPGGGDPTLWPYTEQVSMVNAILMNMDASDEDYEFFTQYLEETLEGLLYFRHKSVSMSADQSWANPDHVIKDFGETDGTANSYAIYDAVIANEKNSRTNGIGDIYFDDNIWVAKEYYYAYLNLGEEKYLNEAINIVNWIVGEGYESTTGLNGIYWNWAAKFKFETGSYDDTTHASLNACSSAPTAMMLGKLYRLLTEEEKYPALTENYLSKAQNIYEFCYLVLRNDKNGCLRDKVFLAEGFQTMTSGQIQMYDEQILPYNTGTFMTAGVELYNISVENGSDLLAEIYLERNQAVAPAADKFFAGTQAVPGQYSYNKNSWFTSFILEGFIDLSVTVDCAEFIEHMRSSLDYGWNNNRDEGGYVCPAWVEGWNIYGTGQDGYQILLQAANAHCYAMLARYYSGI